MKTIFTLFLTILTITFCQAQKVNLSLKLQKGEDYKQTTQAQSLVSQEIMGMKMDITMSIAGTMNYRVKAVNGSVYELDVTYEHMSVSMDMPQGKMDYDSESGTDAFSKVLAAMKNKPFQVKMNKNGKVLEVKNVETLFESAFAKIPEVSETQKRSIMSQLKQAYGEAAFKGNIEMITAIFPDKPVAKGEQWNVATKLESSFPVNLSTTYTYQEEGGDYYKIAGESVVKSEEKGTYVEVSGMSIKYDLEGTMASDIVIDKKSGWIREAKIKQHIEGAGTPKSNGMLPEGFQIPIIVENEIQITGE